MSPAIYPVTMAWLVSLLTSRRARRIGSVAATAITVAAAIEIVIIVGQVDRGRQSHFNMATPLGSALWSTMRSTIVVLWVATFVIAVLLTHQPMAQRATAWAIRLGILVVAGPCCWLPRTA